MNRFIRAVAGLLAGGAVLWLFDLVLDPVPVAAGPAFLLGGVGLMIRQAAVVRPVAVLAIAGALAGMAVHYHWHASGNSPRPAEGLVMHLLVEGMIGLAAALVALSAAGLVLRALGRP